jgi:hypothetical protein
MSYKFNFYSQIKRFEKLESPEDIETFVGKGDAKYILTRQRFESEIRSVSQNKLQLVLAETVGRERWLLLSLCKQGCAPVTLAPIGEARSLSRHDSFQETPRPLNLAMGA